VPASTLASRSFGVIGIPVPPASRVRSAGYRGFRGLVFSYTPCGSSTAGLEVDTAWNSSRISHPRGQRRDDGQEIDRQAVVDRWPPGQPAWRGRSIGGQRWEDVEASEGGSCAFGKLAKRNG